MQQNKHEAPMQSYPEAKTFHPTHVDEKGRQWGWVDKVPVGHYPMHPYVVYLVNDASTLAHNDTERLDWLSKRPYAYAGTYNGSPYIETVGCSETGISLRNAIDKARKGDK